MDAADRQQFLLQVVLQGAVVHPCLLLDTALVHQFQFPVALALLLQSAADAAGRIDFVAVAVVAAE